MNMKKEYQKSKNYMNFQSVSSSITSDAQERKGGIASSFSWMMLLSILLAWIPLIRTGISGYLGDKKAGNVKTI